MGKSLVIKDADFSESGFLWDKVDYESLTLLDGALVDGDWLIPSTGAENKHFEMAIPQGSSKIIIDASTMCHTTHGSTAPSGSSREDSAMLAFLSGTPQNEVDGGTEPTHISSITISVGSTAEIDIPANATVICIHTGYWLPRNSFYLTRLPKSITFTN